MYLFKIGSFLLAAGPVQIINAHTLFSNFFINGVNQGDGTAVRMTNILAQSTFPIKSIESSDMACGVNGEKAVSRVASAKAGDTITFEFRNHPDGSQPGSIDVSHKGPCAVYMKKVDNAAADNNAQGPGWFRIMSDGYDNSTQKWCTEKMNPNDGHLAATIPKDLAPGYYLMRPELLALHAAAKTPPDPQFYIGCAQIFLSSDGSSKPADTVSIPGFVDLNTPAMTYNVWSVPLKLPFPDFGPKIYTGKSKRALGARADMTQTIGLKPPGCVMESVNWCGFLPPKYNDETSCYSSSANCSTQTQDCYNSAGPTGSKNCKNWEAYCTDVRNGCGSGQTTGPPSIDSHLPAAPAKLDPQKVVYMSSTPVPNTVESQSIAPASQSSTAATTTQYSVPAAAFPAGAAVTAGAGIGNESIDTCGTNGGQKCATGMCCSSHGYCGITPEYCADGCQPNYGKCSSSSKSKRFHARSHLLRRKGPQGWSRD